MDNISLLYEKMKLNNNMITTSKGIELGFSKSLLSNFAQKGLIERVRHGVYTIPNSIHDDMYTLMLRSEKIIFSHETALFLNGISERTPFIHTVTIPSDCIIPSSIKDECMYFYIKKELHNLGVIEVKNTFGNNVRCYNKERTICDILRSRNRLNTETVVSAIKNYINSSDKDLNLLAEYSKKLRVSKQLKSYLEVLL
ncbi:MAG: abortive phage infection protein [Clostridia bacterium]